MVRFYCGMVVPLSGPAVATVAILTFLPMWNQYLWPLMSVQTEELRPVMVGIDYFKQLNTSWGQIMAYASMITAPVLVLFIAFQRSFINSIASSGVKGLIVFRLPEAWAWDIWTVDDGEQYHLFLYASRALRDSHARHYRASVGHAVSSDLVHWERVVDALVRSDAPAFDDFATWTGSVVRHPDGRWFMFYTGASLDASGANIQSIGYAVSTDLYVWDKAPGPVLQADGRWYEKYAPPPDGNWHDEAFRDPWVFADPDGDGWHMLITARSVVGPAADPSDRVDRRVVGHAWSADLETWELRPPLSAPGQGFGQLEVFQTHVVDGRQVLLFNCLAGDASDRVRATGTEGGVWIAPAESPLGPYDIAGAQRIDDSTLYVGKFIDDRETGETKFMAFRNETGGQFIGEITDPMTAAWKGDVLLLTP